MWAEEACSFRTPVTLYMMHVYIRGAYPKKISGFEVYAWVGLPSLRLARTLALPVHVKSGILLHLASQSLLWIRNS
jgi:hypothetical protein